MSMKSKLLIFLGVLSIVGLIVLYVNELGWFHNYFYPKNMVLGSLFVGLVIGLALGFRFQKLGEELVDKAQIWTVCVILALLPMPLLASLANRLFAERHTYEVKVEFWDEKEHLIGRSPTIYGFLEGEKKAELGFFIFVIMDGEMIRLKSRTPKFSHLSKGDTVSIPLRKGLFGVAYVDWQN